MDEQQSQGIDPKFLLYMIGKAEVEKELMRQRIQMLEEQAKDDTESDNT